MKARLAYLTSPDWGVFVLNIQLEGQTDVLKFEVSRAHLANIIIDGSMLALRESSNRVPETKETRTGL